MSLRFRRRFHFGKFFSLNLSRSGVSVTAGVRGAHVTAGPRGTTTSMGIPGTGFSIVNHHRHSEDLQ